MERIMESVKSNLPFFKIPFISNLDKQLFSYATTATKWIDYYNFKATPLPIEMVLECDFLNRLYEKHKFSCGLLKMSKKTFYDWHVDDNRGVSINMLLPFGKSYCLFENGERTNNLSGKFTELEYARNTYYAFNNQVPHSVYNFDKIRFLFTIEFEEDKTKLTFDDLIEEIKSW